MAEEIPPEDTLDKLIEATIHLEVVREVADVMLHEEFAAYPELYAHATEEGDRLSESVRSVLAPTAPFPPQAKVGLATAYTRLLFMFTDPSDFKSTPPLDALHGISFDLLASQEEVPPSMVRFASELGGLALDLSLVRKLLKIRGDLDGIVPGNSWHMLKISLILCNCTERKSATQAARQTETLLHLNFDVTTCWQAKVHE